MATVKNGEKQEPPVHWAAVLGKFEFNDKDVVFLGELLTTPDGSSSFPSIGNAISDRMLSGGSVSATITFEETAQSACELILFYDPATTFMVAAGLGSGVSYAIRYYDGRQFLTPLFRGDKANLKANHPYQVRVHRVSADYTLFVDGVAVGSATLPWNLPASQVGVWCSSATTIKVSNFSVATDTPKAFVVMPFRQPYDDLYEHVIKPVCDKLRIEALRADEMAGPGLILEDVIRQIREARLVIAEITEANANVFYEVGYAHAINKDTILIAQKPGELPFDVSGFRTLFYENSISGKLKIEEGLRKFIHSIMAPQLPLT